MIDEPKCIGNISVPEHHGERVGVRADRVGLIQMVLAIPGLVGHLKRAVKNAFVRRQPADSCFSQHGQQLRTDRTFGGPESGRRAAKRMCMVVDRPSDLRLGIGRSVKPGRQRQVGPGATCEFRVDDQRQDRVKERRGRQFDLSTILERRIHRDDLPDGCLL